MGLRNWRWWHWVLVSIGVGGLIGLVLTRMDPDDPSLSSRSWAQLRRMIVTPTEPGKNDSIVTRIRISPVVPDNAGKPVQAITFWERMRNKKTGQWDPTRQFRTVAPVPLAPPPEPAKTVMDFIKEQQQPGGGAKGRELDVRYMWWWEPRKLWLMSLGGAVLGIGILWPLTLKGLVRLGLAEPPDERGMDLSQVSSKTKAPTPSTGQVVTSQDRERLDALNAELEANVAGMTVTGDPAAGDKRPAVPTGPRVLVAEAAKPTEAVADEKPHEYAGEFYPVAKPTKDEHE